MEKEEQHLSLPDLGEMNEGNYYHLSPEINSLALAQHLAHFFYPGDKSKGIGFSGAIDVVPDAAILCRELSPQFDIKCSTGVTGDGISVVILISYPTTREGKIRTILSQNKWITYAPLFGKNHFMSLVVPDDIHVDGDVRKFIWTGYGVEVYLRLWENWEVIAEKKYSFLFQDIDSLVKILPNGRQPLEWDDRFCGAIVAIKVAQTQGMLNKEQAFLLSRAFCKTHDLILDEEDADKLLKSEPVNQYVNLFVAKNR